MPLNRPSRQWANRRVGRTSGASNTAVRDRSSVSTPLYVEIGSLESEETIVHPTLFHVLATFPLLLITAAATHLVTSFTQTLMHYKLGHHRMGGKFFCNHMNFHHAYYSEDHLVSRTYLGDKGNNTPFFFIPFFLAGACAYLVLPLDLFVVAVLACAVSFYAHVFFDKEYHVEGSRFQCFAWFRRKRGATLRPSPAYRLQLRGDRLFLGSASRHL